MQTDRNQTYLRHVPRARYLEHSGRSSYFLTEEELRAGASAVRILRHRRALRRRHRRLKSFTTHRSAAAELTRQMNRGHLLGRFLRALAHPLTTLRRTLTRSVRLRLGNRRRFRLRRIYESLNPTA